MAKLRAENRRRPPSHQRRLKEAGCNRSKLLKNFIGGWYSICAGLMRFAREVWHRRGQ